MKTLTVGRAALSELRSGARSANVVICVLDAARADHVGCYGYSLDTTPNLDQLAKESVLFRNHFTPCPSTKYSTASLFTGLYFPVAAAAPRGSHDAGLRGGDRAFPAGAYSAKGARPPRPTGAPTREVSPDRVDEGRLTIAKALRPAGFGTAFFSSNPVASPADGIGADFEQVFVDPSARGSAKQERITLPGDAWMTPEGLTEVFGKWLAGQRTTRFFAYLHFLPPHDPYNAPDAVKQFFAGKGSASVRRGQFEFPEVRPDQHRVAMMHLPHEPSVDLYDANLRWADWGIGEVVKALRERDLLDNTILVVTSDHGEAFGEHGYIWHSRAVYGEFVHIPLLIRFPGPPNGGLVGAVGALTGTVDLLPTILDLFQVPYPRESIQGLSVLPLLSGERTKVHDYTFARSVDAWQSYLVRNLDWSLILYRGGEFKALYDLRTDPGELRNVIGRFRPKAAAEERRSLEVAGKMSTALQRFGDTQRLSLAEFISPHAVVKAPGSNPAGPVPGKLPEEVRRKIRALGYLD